MQPSSSLVLRPGTVRDADLIALMHSQSWASAYRGMLPDAYLDEIAPAERHALWPRKMQALEAGAGAVVIAERDGHAIGFVCMLKPDENGSVYIDNLHALPAAKKTGAGTAMLDAARRWSKERDARQMHLSVLNTNLAAIGFYESRGWRLAGREEEPMGGIVVTVLTYRIDL